MDFEKLDVWRRAARLSVELYRQLRTLNDWGFRDQITRSGLSIPSNIAEGMSREGRRERVRFLLIAKGFLRGTEDAAVYRLESWLRAKNVCQSRHTGNPGDRSHAVQPDSRHTPRLITRSL